MIRLGGYGAEIAKRLFKPKHRISDSVQETYTQSSDFRSILRNMIEVFSQNKMKKALRRNLTSALNYIQVDSSGMMQSFGITLATSLRLPMGGICLIHC